MSLSTDYGHWTYTRQRWAPMAPAPVDADRCRWCGRQQQGRRFCETGCYVEPVFTKDCPECGRSFKTGNNHAVTCYGCDQRENRVAEAAGRSVSVHGPASIGRRGSRTRRA